MNTLKPKIPIIIIAIYLLVVIACILLAFNFAVDIKPGWTLVLIGLTLPWSLISILFTWALIHGAGLEFFTFMYLVFAGLNSFIFYWFCSLVRRNSEEGES